MEAALTSAAPPESPLAAGRIGPGVIAPDDWRSLLEPIPGEDPSGTWLHYDPLYDQVRRARTGDDETLAQGVWETAARRANWGEVASLCTSALATRTKDLQLSVWLAEAWMHLHGLRGAAAGMKLAERLCEQYWEGLHPRGADGDWESRHRIVEWINDRLLVRLKLVPLTVPAEPGCEPVSWSDWENAQRHTQWSGRSEASLAAAAEAKARIQASLLATPEAWLAEQRHHAEATAAAALGIEQCLDRAAGAQAPGLVAFRRTAEAIAQFMGGALPQAPAGSAATVAGEEAPVLLNESAPEFIAGPTRTPIATREDAYAALSAAAAFLRRTEPHSPVPYLVERAIAWGRMSLGELLNELVGDAGQLGEIHRLLRLGTARPSRTASG